MLPPSVNLAALALAVNEGFKHGKDRGVAENVSCRWRIEDGPEMGGWVQGFGFGDFGTHRGEHVSKEQIKSNCVIDVTNLQRTMQMCSVLPGLMEVMNFCLSHCKAAKRQLEVAYVHLLNQESDQVVYDWHRDHKSGKGYGDIKLTYAFLLDTPGWYSGRPMCRKGYQTSVQIGGKAEYFYEAPGYGVMFHSVLWHRTGRGGGRKLVVFIKDMKT